MAHKKETHLQRSREREERNDMQLISKHVQMKSKGFAQSAEDISMSDGELIELSSARISFLSLNDQAHTWIVFCFVKFLFFYNFIFILCIQRTCSQFESNSFFSHYSANHYTSLSQHTALHTSSGIAVMTLHHHHSAASRERVDELYSLAYGQ